MAPPASVGMARRRRSRTGHERKSGAIPGGRHGAESPVAWPPAGSEWSAVGPRVRLRSVRIASRAFMLMLSPPRHHAEIATPLALTGEDCATGAPGRPGPATGGGRGSLRAELR